DVVDHQDFLAAAVHFHDLVAGDDQDMVIGQGLNVVGHAIDALLPHDFALEVAFGHSAAVVFGNQHALVGQHPCVGGILDAAERPARLVIAPQLLNDSSLGPAQHGIAQVVLVWTGQTGQVNLAGVFLPPGGPGLTGLFS